MTSFANADVLAFYKEMPFNFLANAKDQADAVREQNNVKDYYAPLEPFLTAGARVLDVGCGTGWFAQTMAHHYPVSVTGIDFNPVAISRARESTVYLKSPATFIATDLFAFCPDTPFDVVTSIGVLHHTDDCIAGVRHCAKNLVAENGILFIGLYHTYGRKPFLDYFEAMKKAGASEAEMLAAYAKLSPNDQAEETFLKSWFRDQVLHPHETQHTLAEIVPVLHAEGLTLLATSINGFQPIENLEALFDLEKTFEARGQDKLAASAYYPGFFVVLAQKNKG